MSLERLNGPAQEPLSLAEAKLFLRIEDTFEDAAIAQMIAAARAEFERETGLILIDQVWRLSLEDLPETDETGLRVIRLPLRPLKTATVLEIADDAGVFETIAAEAIRLDLNADRPRLIEAAPGLWPLPGLAQLGIRVTFTAGYGATAAFVPEDIRRLLLRLIGDAYETRGSLTAEVPQAEERSRLFAPFRSIRL